MPYEISWYVENRVIYSRWWGEVTPQEMTASRYDAQPMIEQADPSQLHTIIDMSEVTNFRVGVNQIKQDAQPKQDLTAVGGWMLYVGTGRIIKVLIQIGARVAGMKTRTFDTLPEALKYLMTVDPSLADALSQRDPAKD